MSEMKDREIEIGIGVDTAELDEAVEKADELVALTQDVAPMVSIRHLRGCTVNVYVSRNTWSEDGGAE